MITKKTIHWDDIFFSVVVEVDESFPMQVKVYEVTSVAKSGERTYYSEENGYCAHPSLEGAASCIEGHIKWDGCSDWSFGQMHFCCMRQGQNIGVVFERLYRLAAEIMPGFDGIDFDGIDAP